MLVELVEKIEYIVKRGSGNIAENFLSDIWQIKVDTV